MAANAVMGIVFSNMHDDNLEMLTEKRTVASVPFGGRYRFIDFTLSNMVNSGILDVGVITKSNYQSLMDHVGAGRPWDMSRKRGGLTILPPFSRGSGLYRGSVEALNGAMGYLRHMEAKYVVLCDCDVIANIDFRPMLEAHIQSGAHMTLAYQRCHLASFNRDVMTLTTNATGRIVDMLADPQEEGEYDVFLNVSILERELLIKMVGEALGHNMMGLTRDYLQSKVDHFVLQGYRLEGYTSRIYNLASYFNANMELLDEKVQGALFPRERPIYTKVRDEVPAKYGLKANVANSLIADGCIIEGRVENCILFRQVKIGRGAVVKNCILMQGTTVGENSNLSYVVSDKDVTIQDNRQLAGFATYPLYIAKGIRI